MEEDDAKQELGERLELLGAVQGERKVKFFNSIDLLLFPTRYPTEAFSIILIEALMAGCPVITYGRGCIPVLSYLQTVHVLHPELDFPTTAISILAAWSKTKNTLSELKTQAHRDGIDLHRAHVETHNTLIETIIGAKHLSRRQPSHANSIEGA